MSEAIFTRNYENYGFYEGESPPNYEYCQGENCEHEFNTPEIQQRRNGQLKKACSQHKATGDPYPCTSDCFWDPEVTVRDFEKLLFTCSNNGDYSPYEAKGACDCPCDDLVTVEAPTVLSMTLPYLAQAAVATIVGLNTGFRKVNIETWKKWFKQKRGKGKVGASTGNSSPGSDGSSNMSFSSVPAD